MPASPLFAVLAAAFWGMGDFSGGMGVKCAPSTAHPMAAALRVVILSHLTSLSVLLAIVLLRHDPFPHGAPLAWGIAAGIFGGLSLSGFYIALSRGAMGASAAVSGLLAAAIPATVAILREGSPGPHRLFGFVVAGLAIWIIAAGPAQREDSPTILLATAAGVGFGLYFVALKFAGVTGLFWPMATARMGSISTCLIVLAVFHLCTRKAASVTISRRMILWILSTALFDTSGNLLFVAATRAGRLDIAAVLASLYPASTILLAAAVLQERPTRRQLSGMAIAVVAVALITL